MHSHPGKHFPLGASWDGEGTNFALYSEGAERVELCLFDAGDNCRQTEVVELVKRTHSIWHVYLPGVGAGARYGYRVDGPYKPEEGSRYNACKLLIDPYARAVDGLPLWGDELYGYRRGDEREDLSRDDRDSGPLAPKCVVIDERFDWGDDNRPCTPLERSLIYEAHVKGFTRLCSDVPQELRGTYAGLASPAAIDHLCSLGVTAIELLPVQYFIDKPFYLDHGRINYWGYDTLAYFAPAGRYAAADDPGDQVREFKGMVKALHAAGIEVILDVCYSHTGEGNELGPTLSLRGVDNATYYRLVEDAPRYYEDTSSHGNVPNMMHPQAIRMIADSLRYWAGEMRIDGFRFDMAPTLGREPREFDRLSSFFDILNQDPLLTKVKLIAEPWDAGKQGYQVGSFPPPWAEWNAAYRDTVRRFWRGDEGQAADMSNRLTASSDLFQASRGPYASINVVSLHDGFTLHDLVSYDQKHNEANGEDNRDGPSQPYSWNCGVEGPTDDPDVLELRERQKRNFLATLFVSQGVPMIQMGDEVSRTQDGNNNAYCHDSELTWFDWTLDTRKRDLLEFARHASRLMRDHPVLHSRDFRTPVAEGKSIVESVAWFRPDGQPLSEHDWQYPNTRCFSFLLRGDRLVERNSVGERLRDDHLLVLLNAWQEAIDFRLPAKPANASWTPLLDTRDPLGRPPEQQLNAEQCYELSGRSVAVLSQPVLGQ